VAQVFIDQMSFPSCHETKSVKALMELYATCRIFE